MVAFAIARGLTEDEARDETVRIAGSAVKRIERFVTMLAAENEAQNLVSKSSLLHVWTRHVLDSVQLVSFSRAEDKRWLDIGTGAGFPGLVIAMLDRFEVLLVEPRRRRAEFLSNCIERLTISNASVAAQDAKSVEGAAFDIVSARAVASTADLLAMSAHFAKPSTRFIFPKGAHAATDVETAQRDWHGMFHVEHSRTSPTSGIVVIDQVRAK